MPRALQIFILILCNKFIFAQGVCDKIGQNDSVIGGFTFESLNTGCPPLSIELKDNSGGTDVKYIFGYQGEDVSKLSSINSVSIPKWEFLAPGNYSILQYGKKNGKDMYYCSNVQVQSSPTFTYNSCNRNFISLTISASTTNKFDYYEINWGDGRKENTTIGVIPPITRTHNYSTSSDSKLITLTAFKNGTAATCTFTQNVDMRGGGSDFPVITQLALNDDGNQATVQLKGSNNVSYTLLQRLSSDFQFGKVHATDISYPTTGITIKPGVTQIPISDPTKSYCFVVQSSSRGCGIPQSNEICTIPLDISILNNTTNHLEWGKHFSLTITDPRSDFGQAVLPNNTVTISKEEIGGVKTTISKTGQTYDDLIDCSKNYCYQVEVKVTGESSNLENHYGKADPLISSVSVSPRKCIDRKNIQAPPITAGLVTVNTQNKIEATWTDNLTWEPKRKKYIFWRADSQNGKFEKTDSVFAPLTKYTDLKIDASTQQYCYKISFVDECGTNSLISNPFCSIFLQNDKNALKWTSDLPFDLEIYHYVVEYSDELSNIYTLETNTSNTNYVADLTKFQEKATYRIKVTSKTNSEVSYSNIITIPIKLTMLFPEVFTPNGDNKNDNFIPVGGLKRIQNFILNIYNRWGNIISEISNITEGWDGTLSSGEKAPPGVYSFRAYITLDDGTTLTRSGNVILLK